MTTDETIQQKTVKFDTETAQEIEATAHEDFRSFGAQVRYLVALGLRARRRRYAASDGHFDKAFDVEERR